MCCPGVPATNQNHCFFGKVWKFKSNPFTWHQDERNPVLSPGGEGRNSRSFLLDAMLHLTEEEAHNIHCSGTTTSVKHRIGLAICPAGERRRRRAARGRTSRAPVRAGR